MAHDFDWRPTAAYTADEWVTLQYLKRRTGFDQSEISTDDLTELRKDAIDTLILETNRWFGKWQGTFYGLRGQQGRLYLPVPIVLEIDGGTAPVVTYYNPEGEQTDISVINQAELAYLVRGRNAKQPYIQLESGVWDPSRAVKIEATFGEVDAFGNVPGWIQQTIVGLVRWHSLGFGVGPDEARDMATLNRISNESTRGRTVTYAKGSMGQGVTGDRVIDRNIDRATIEPAPYAVNG